MAKDEPTRSKLTALGLDPGTPVCQEFEMSDQLECGVVVGVNVEQLGARVNEALDHGWEPYGGLCAIPSGLAQGVVRDPTRVVDERGRRTSLDDSAQPTEAS